jgi:hypothetical protein
MQERKGAFIKDDNTHTPTQEEVTKDVSIICDCTTATHRGKERRPKKERSTLL